MRCPGSNPRSEGLVVRAGSAADRNTVRDCFAPRTPAASGRPHRHPARRCCALRVGIDCGRSMGRPPPAHSLIQAPASRRDMDAISHRFTNHLQPGNARVRGLCYRALYVELKDALGRGSPALAQPEFGRLAVAQSRARPVRPGVAFVATNEIDVGVLAMRRPVMHEVVEKLIPTRQLVSFEIGLRKREAVIDAGDEANILLREVNQPLCDFLA